jgi:serum/glucocorticoid-regulated kinase 2
VNTNPTSDSTLKPGRLTVQIYEAKGLSLPPGVNRTNERPASSSASAATLRGHDRAKPSRSHLALPYIVLEFDKNQVLLETNYGELSAPVWGRVQDLYLPLSFSSAAHVYMAVLIF